MADPRSVPPKDMVGPHLIEGHGRSKASIIGISWEQRLSFHKSLHRHPGGNDDHDHDVL